MARLSKEFKEDVNQGVKEFDYITRKIVTRVTVAVLVISVASAVGGVAYKRFKVNQDRITFKQSTTYNEGVLDDLAKYRFEMLKAEDDIEKKAIADLVRGRFANYDTSKIENADLRKFLKDCLEGKY